MPETGPSSPMRVEILTAQGTEGLLIYSPAESSVGIENGQSYLLQRWESRLLGLLLEQPNWPHKLADIRQGIPDFNDKYAPPPSEVIKGILESAPFLSGYLLAIVEGRTQLFSFLDREVDTKEFLQNVDPVLENNGERFARPSDPKRHNRIRALVAIAINWIKTLQNKKT
jgi:hypothetical protein